MNGSNLNLTFGTEVIYDGAEFNINNNDKVGVVGVNGAGKTTLFKVLLNELPIDSGKIKIDKDKRIGYLPQEIVLDDQNLIVFDYLMKARPIQLLEKKLIDLYEKVAVATTKQQAIFDEISKTQDLLDYYDYYHAENVLMELISDMHIDSKLLDMRLGDLSGGQKSKIAFAHLLYSNPEVLLLDEPTNHLDYETRDFVINYLKLYKGTILIISHDIAFLDAIVNKVMYLNKVNHKIDMYDGNYTLFKKKLSISQELKERLIEKQEKETDKLRSIVLHYSNSSGDRKRMAVSREKMLEKKMKEQLTRDDSYRKVKLNIKPNREGSKIPIKVNNIVFNYPNKETIINNLSFLINNKERFLIVGANGVGKSTLLKLLVGVNNPIKGEIVIGNKTDIAYYAQEQELLDMNKTVLENVDSNEYGSKEIRTILGSFLFAGDEVFKKATVLSPGEKARIALCKVMLARANVLILDEPTNHLDPETQAIIGDNFKNYDGTIILVSHNPSFVRNVGIDRMLVLPSGKIINYSDEVLEYYYNLNSKND